MRKNAVLLVILLGIVLPGILFDQTWKRSTNVSTAEIHTVEYQPAISINVKNGEQVSCVQLEDYIIGVVLGEMPATFELEALKAQAVATRTYTLHKILKQGKHDDADVCADSSCCQAYINKNDYLLSKGTKADVEKIETAVHDTEGQVLTYKGELIEATYFSCSGGMTEDAVAVWGTSVPYLESVISPGENQAKYFETERIFTVDEFLTLLGVTAPTSLEDSDVEFTYTDGNGVETMTLFGTSFTGIQVRKLLNLPSTAFSLTINGKQVVIKSRGYGHRVGMSQYGADAMAMNGSTYGEILLHYYKGTSLVKLTDDQLKGLFDKEGNI